MSLRTYLNDNPTVSAAIVLGALLVVAVVAYSMLRGPALPPVQAYFVDLETGEIFVAPEAEAGASPASPDGNPAARARVYTCDDCEPDMLFVGRAERGGTLADGTLEVSRDQQTWTRVTDEEELVEGWGPPPCPDGSMPTPCYPEDE